MKTKIVKADPREEGNWLHEAGDILKNGGLVAFPTETVYGLGADAFNSAAAERIYEAKGRPSDNPLIVHIADRESLDRLLKDPRDEAAQTARRLADAFWPGPLTMVLNKTDDLPAQTTGGLKTVAVRLPAHETARSLIRAAGGFVAAPSANLSGKPSPTCAAHCIADLDGRVDMIIDGGDCEIGLESTIVDVTQAVPEILRPGKITRQELFAALDLVPGEDIPEETLLSADDKTAPRAPGMKYRHYAPKGTLVLVQGDADRVTDTILGLLKEARAENKKSGVIAADESRALYAAADVVAGTGKETDADALAHNLYRVLRGMDEAGAEIIYFAMPNTNTYTDAVRNRLNKACGGRVITV